MSCKREAELPGHGLMITGMSMMTERQFMTALVDVLKLSGMLVLEKYNWNCTSMSCRGGSLGAVACTLGRASSLYYHYQVYNRYILHT